ncbi:MAG: efflux RND transporter periplasmic adaptor subunit [Verrucomicrobiota bacterium JB023]|nr:efflux RND transporter periplasmic adaptor subunit [Verrucomicrobiota bacterium JB023]
MSEEREIESEEELEVERRSAVHAVLSFVGVLLVLGLAIAGIAILLATAPEAAKKEEEAIAAPAVEVREVTAVEGGVEVRAEGIVESRQVVRLTTEVSGKVVEMSPSLRVGGRVSAGELLVQLEQGDYRTALEQAKASVAEAELNLKQEEARRAQALRDWEKLGRGEPGDLLVRVPQLASAKASLASAKAEVERARRNLERTVVRAPFDAIVREEEVERGAVLAVGSPVATLFSSQALDVILPVKLEDFALLRRDSQGNPIGSVELEGTLGARKIVWPGRIVRTTGEVERSALTAGLVVAVEPTDDEGELNLPPPGLFVEARLEGEALPDAMMVPRSAVREGDRVAIVDEEDKLRFRNLTIVRSTADTVFATDGVTIGEQVIITRLNGPVEGMPVRTGEEEPSEKD